MYSTPASLILGFHGCDRSVGERLLAGEIARLNKSENTHDWIGHGVYFWEHNPERALDFARELRDSPRAGKQPIEDPFVVGAIIDPGNCLNLLESKSLRLVRQAYEALQEASDVAGTELPSNVAGSGSEDLLRRNLDCAVIEALHGLNEAEPFDSVRGVFQEVPALYPGAGFREKNHIQICVRTTANIRGYFRLL